MASPLSQHLEALRRSVEAAQAVQEAVSTTATELAAQREQEHAAAVANAALRPPE